MFTDPSVFIWNRQWSLAHSHGMVRTLGLPPRLLAQLALLLLVLHLALVASASGWKPTWQPTRSFPLPSVEMQRPLTMRLLTGPGTG